MVSRGDVYWVELDPTVGSEIRKTRPCLIISPDDMNQVLPRVIIAPITSKGQRLGCRPEVIIKGKRGRVLLDQIRTVDKKRLQGKVTHLPLLQWHDTLIQMLS
ncbi:type II toxin-antitoxin system PemK/MazF family toxin [Aequoribacter sp.]|jgi:mRNA interferase MazF|uniref:type II toxin-antitoxin system PemK/MazF family toxin n=2 Tax=Aequoribacter sp. TaxID=2847771 RepID=UPI003C66EF10